MAYKCMFCAKSSDECLAASGHQFCDMNCVNGWCRQESQKEIEKEFEQDRQTCFELKLAVARNLGGNLGGHLTFMYKERFARFLFHQALLNRSPKEELVRLADALYQKKEELFNAIDGNDELKEEYPKLFYDVSSDLNPLIKKYMKVNLTEIWGV